MSESTDIIKREVGERVDIACHFEPDSVKALEDGVFEAIVTTSEVDRHNESIATEGIDTDNWEKNSPTVLYGHDYFNLPIGKGISLKRYKNKLVSKFQLAVEEYDFAATVAKLIKGGFLTAVSIGGVVREWSEDYKTILKMEMVEFSVVPIPANRGALITGKSFEDVAGKSPEEFRKEFEGFAKKYMIDRFKNMGNDELTTSVKVLKNLVATLEESIEANSSAGDESTETKKIRKLRIMESAKAIDKESERIIRRLKLKD